MLSTSKICFGCHRELWLPNGNDEDISTLGDPIAMSNGAMRMGGGDDPSMNTAALDRMLDANTHYPSQQNVLVDPGDCFDVRVPAGKLGVILEEFSEDGYPIVHGVKHNSPLSSRIEKGDRLCSVDGVDCSGKQATGVAKLLKARESESSRILTFYRPSQS